MFWWEFSAEGILCFRLIPLSRPYAPLILLSLLFLYELRLDGIPMLFYVEFRPKAPKPCLLSLGPLADPLLIMVAPAVDATFKPRILRPLVEVEAPLLVRDTQLSWVWWSG